MDLTGSVKKLFSSEASVFRQFADQHDIVYFGRLHQEDEDQRIVRGVTVSTRHNDEHYCVGTVHGFDIVLLKRTDKLSRPNTNRTENYSWILLQIDLRIDHDLPHVFLDGGHHNEVFYQSLFVKFARLMKVDKAQFGIDSQFNDRFTAYTPPDALDELPLVVAGDVGETMAHHFAHLDFEWFQDRLIIYSTGRMPTKHLLDHMLRAGLWLADVLEKYAAAQKHPPLGEQRAHWNDR